MSSYQLKNNRITTGLAAAMAILFLVPSCGNRNKATDSPEAPEVTEPVVETHLTAAQNYLTETIGKEYASGEICIAYQDYIDVDESNPEDIQVWGDFWVENYNVVGDTLMFVSGGNHCGKMHVKKDPEGHFSVQGFDAVSDGSNYLPTAKVIFGDKFEEFQKAYSDDKGREEVRKKAVSEYVHANKLPVKYYKDYGWPAVRIPAWEE